MSFSYSLDFQTLASHYKTGLLKPTAMVAELFSRIQASGDDHVWTHVLPQTEVTGRKSVSRPQRDEFAKLQDRFGS